MGKFVVIYKILEISDSVLESVNGLLNGDDVTEVYSGVV